MLERYSAPMTRTVSARPASRTDDPSCRPPRKPVQAAPRSRPAARPAPRRPATSTDSAGVSRAAKRWTLVSDTRDLRHRRAPADALDELGEHLAGPDVHEEVDAA